VVPGSFRSTVTDGAPLDVANSNSSPDPSGRRVSTAGVSSAGSPGSDTVMELAGVYSEVMNDVRSHSVGVTGDGVVGGATGVVIDSTVVVTGGMTEGVTGGVTGVVGGATVDGVTGGLHTLQHGLSSVAAGSEPSSHTLGTVGQFAL